MTENRDFLGEMAQLRAETDGIRDALTSKTGHLNNSDCAILKEVVGELRCLRMEMKEKMEEMTKNQQLQNEKIEKISEELAAIRLQSSQVAPAIPIREAILGKWKMIQHENFEAAQRTLHQQFDKFCQNLNYELQDGKLKETGGVYGNLVEGQKTNGYEDLYVADNCLKTSRLVYDYSVNGQRIVNIDRYILDGKLHVVVSRLSTKADVVWKQTYMKL